LDLGKAWWQPGWDDGSPVAARAMDWVIRQLKDLGVIDIDAEIEFD
jgi:hypothetical protein